MKVGIVDFGTNTFKLVVFEKQGDDFAAIEELRLPVKIGLSGFYTNCISEDAFERGLDAVKTFKALAEKHGCKKVFGLATSALRDATNGKEFVQKAKEISGFHIEIIDGKREAELICKGVMRATEQTPECSLIMDIGGGSTEFILMKGKEILFHNSYPLGVTRLKEAFKTQDPLSFTDVLNLTRHFDELTKDLQSACENSTSSPTLIGAAGVFETYEEMLAARFDLPYQLKKYSAFETKKLVALFEELIVSSFEQRNQMKGLIDMRKDTVNISSLLTKWTIETFGVHHASVSSASMIEGFIEELRIDF